MKVTWGDQRRTGQGWRDQRSREGGNQEIWVKEGEEDKWVDTEDRENPSSNGRQVWENFCAFMDLLWYTFSRPLSPLTQHTPWSKSTNCPWLRRDSGGGNARLSHFISWGTNMLPPELTTRAQAETEGLIANTERLWTLSSALGPPKLTQYDIGTVDMGRRGWKSNWKSMCIPLPGNKRMSS